MAGAAEVRAFQVTCPPGTTQDAPFIADLLMPVRIVDEIRVRVPPGPLSSMGFAIGAGGVPIIPYDSDVFVVANDETFTWDLADQIESGAWQALMFNNGQYPHTIYIYFTVHLPDVPSSLAPVGLISAAALGSVASVASASIPASPPLSLAASA